MTTKQTLHTGLSHRILSTLVIGAIFAAVVCFVQVPTTLGVKAPRPLFGEPDLSGRDHIWRIWWRAHDDLIDVSPQWVVTAGLIALLAIFAAGVLLAIWLVTGPATDDDIARTDG